MTTMLHCILAACILLTPFGLTSFCLPAQIIAYPLAASAGI